MKNELTALAEILNSEPQPPRAKRDGLVIVNTGDGKGKSSAAFGVTFRATGWNWKIKIIQFIKGTWKTGEKNLADALPNIEMYSMGDGFTWDTKNPEQDIKTTESIWTFAKESIEAAEHDLIILDEINFAMNCNYLSPEPVIEAFAARPKWMHIICTGRGAPQRIIDAADLVTEMKVIKHPFEQGIHAQRGIEF